MGQVKIKSTLGFWATVRAMLRQAGENLGHRAQEGREPEIPKATIRRLAKLPVLRPGNTRET